MRSAALLGVLPALPLLILGISGEYWGRIYLLWGVAFAVLNCLALGLLLGRVARDHEEPPSTWRLLYHQVGAWCVSLLVLGVIDITPLCLGQDNGDGRNSLAMCALLTVVWSVSMSVIVVPAAFAVSMAARRVVHGGRRHEEGPH